MFVRDTLSIKYVKLWWLLPHIKVWMVHKSSQSRLFVPLVTLTPFLDHEVGVCRCIFF